MTAEIAILNKTAVALAADSAITFGPQKIYNSGNKLFSLSVYRPVGIMVYGNAEFLGVPWETIIKMYRANLKKKKYDKLMDYANDFISFLENEDSMFWSAEIQLKYFQDTIQAYFKSIVVEINERVSLELEKNKLTVEQIGDLASASINEHYKSWQEATDLFPNVEEYINKIIEKYGNSIEQTRTNVFQQLPLSADLSDILSKICGLIFCKQRFSESLSGIVIAGFGEKEIFPTAVEFRLETVMSGKLKYIQVQNVQASREQFAVIMPFAQQEMVKTFVEGIDPSYSGALHSYFSELINKYPKDILSVIPELTAARRTELLDKLGVAAKEVLSEFTQNTQNFSRNNYVNPILQAVSALPKDELASMAESLVNLTSFKRRVTLQAETVGGPIDVAVISKGDGFVWIKRKHYFKSELNQAFFSNYFREDSDNQAGE